jgi:predicted aspartyl protease
MGARSIAAGLAALGLAAVVSGPAVAGCFPNKVAELSVTMDGLTPLVRAKVNGVDATFIADTGAFFSLIKPQLVLKFSLNVNQGLFPIEGATGETQAQAGWAQDFTVLGFTLHHVDFLLSAPEVGADADGVLGANILSAYDTEYDLADGVIRFFQPPHGCAGGAPASWDQAAQVSQLKIERVTAPTHQIVGQVIVNGVKLRAIFDTGATMSVLTMQAARKAGITQATPGVVVNGSGEGISRDAAVEWLAPVRSFQLGQEQIADTHLRFADVQLDGADMLIGADFFISHRVMVATSQSEIYFTASGGPGSWTEQSASLQLAPPESVAEPSGDPDDQPKGAAEFDRLLPSAR